MVLFYFFKVTSRCDATFLADMVDFVIVGDDRYRQLFLFVLNLLAFLNTCIAVDRNKGLSWSYNIVLGFNWWDHGGWGYRYIRLASTQKICKDLVKICDPLLVFVIIVSLDVRVATTKWRRRCRNDRPWSRIEWDWCIKHRRMNCLNRSLVNSKCRTCVGVIDRRLSRSNHVRLSSWEWIQKIWPLVQCIFEQSIFMFDDLKSIVCDLCAWLVCGGVPLSLSLMSHRWIRKSGYIFRDSHCYKCLDYLCFVFVLFCKTAPQDVFHVIWTKGLLSSKVCVRFTSCGGCLAFFELVWFEKLWHNQTFWRKEYYIFNDLDPNSHDRVGKRKRNDQMASRWNWNWVALTNRFSQNKGFWMFQECAI